MIEIQDIEPSQQFAFVTLLYGNQPFFVEALVLAISLKPLNNQADLVIMIGDGVSKPVIDLIRKTKLFKHMVHVPALTIHDSHVGTVNRWNKLIFNKCYSWALTQYKKVAFVDADFIIHNHDEFITLFHDFLQSNIPAACLMGESLITHNEVRKLPRTCPEHSKLSGGLIVLTPSKTTFKHMVRRLRKPSVYDGQFFTNHEEVFLGYFFPEWATIHIRFSYAPLWLLTYHKAKPLLAPITINQVVATHFVGYKPHLYLLKEEYIRQDDINYKKGTHKNGSDIFRYSQTKWLQIANKLDVKIYKNLGKHLTDFGDWVMPIKYNT